MKIINNKEDAIQELKRISTRTNSENNNKITAIVEEILREVKNHGDIAVENTSSYKSTLATCLVISKTVPDEVCIFSSFRRNSPAY